MNTGASGYNWTLTGDGKKPLQVNLNEGSYSETFVKSDFLPNTSAWRSAGYDDYPVHED